MSEAVSMRQDQSARAYVDTLEQVDPQAIELGLQRIFFDLLEGRTKPEVALGLARVADSITRKGALQVKLLRMTTKAPSVRMLAKWGLD